MLVNQIPMPKIFHFQLDSISKFGTVGDKFQEVVGARPNMFYPPPDPTISVRATFESKELSRVTSNSAEIDPAGLSPGYFPSIPMPALGKASSVLRSFKCRVGDSVGGLLRSGKMRQEGTPHHDGDQD